MHEHESVIECLIRYLMDKVWFFGYIKFFMNLHDVWWIANQDFEFYSFSAPKIKSDRMSTYLVHKHVWYMLK